MGRLMGLEPTTFGFTVRRSNQLSYSRQIDRSREKATEVYEKGMVLQFYFVFFVFSDRIRRLYRYFSECIWLSDRSVLLIISGQICTQKTYRSPCFLFLWSNNIYSSIEFARQIRMKYGIIWFVRVTNCPETWIASYLAMTEARCSRYTPSWFQYS